jgi:hypothetical protein
MLRLSLLTVLVLFVSCSKETNTAYTLNPQKKLNIPLIEKNKNTIVLDEIKVFDKKPIALVLHNETIYHCSDLTTDDCGLNAECGEYKLNCLKNPTVEYLR